MELRSVDPKTLAFNPNNPRRVKAAKELDAQLTANIRAIGVIQPPLVRADGDMLEIIAGERRVRCAIAAGVTELHVLVSSVEDGNDPLRALAENTQRSQMNPVDQWRSIEALCGSGWGEEAIATAFSMTVRTIRKLRLLASIHPKMLDRMAFDLPDENELRKIAAAPLDEQAAAWKRLKPKKGEAVCWWEIVQALDTRRIPATAASFDKETAIAFGILWQEDLFGPADEDNRYTTDVEAFFMAQRHWMETQLPENGMVLELDRSGYPLLPPKAEQCWGTPKDGDSIGFYLNQRTGKIEQMAFRMAEPVRNMPDHAAHTGQDGSQPAGRPEITKKGCEQIGDYRTDALRRSFQEADLDDGTLIGLLVLAFAAENVEVRGDYTNRSDRARIAGSLTEGDVLTADATLLRQAGRDMLAQVLNCSERFHGSGKAGRIAGTSIDADRYLPSMAGDDFLKSLSKAGIERTAREAGVPVLPQTGKEIRAALLRHVGQDHYVLPEARFAFTAAEQAEEQRRSERLQSYAGRETATADEGDDQMPEDGRNGFQADDDENEMKEEDVVQDAA